MIHRSCRDHDKRTVGCRCGIRGLARSVFALAMLALLIGCQTSPGTELLEVGRVEPRQVHFGAPWSVIGDGFALGKPALVTLDGTIYRAGRSPKPVRFSVRAATQSKERLRVVLPREAQALACGAPDDASHATFRGSIQVAIAASSAGAPPVTGILRGATLELYPSARTRAAEQQALRGAAKIVAYLGVELDSTPDGGLQIVGMDPKGRAARAGLLLSDRIIRAGGVTALQPSDLTSDAARTLALVVVRGQVERRVDIDIEGLSDRPPSALQWASLPVGAAALLLLLRGLSPIGLVSGIDPVHGIRRWRRRPPAARQVPAQTVRMGLYLSLSCVAVVLICSAFGRSIGFFEQPAMLLLPLMAGAATLSGAGALVRAGRVDRHSWSFWRGGLAALGQLVFVLPALVALARILYLTGFDFVRAAAMQGPWPSSWLALANPGEWILFSLFILTPLSCGAPEPERSWRPTRRSRAERLKHLLSSGWSDLYLCSTAAVATLLFLGGTCLPIGFAHLPGLSVALLLLKFLALVYVLVRLRARVQGVTHGEWLTLGGVVALPLAILGTGLSFAWGSLSEASPVVQWLDTGFGSYLWLALTVGGLVLGFRWWSEKDNVLGAGEVSPWL